ncbi:amidase [Enterovirga rhinocerotis]|uniref:amidase n=1 Tax=Enterovirga rhinocerotis TaxID=1339210 RepID=UPI00105CD4C3|nr:amidase family protein [Enterovirga rhinocerotis]
MSAVEAVERLRSGEVSPLEMVEAAIARIEAVDGEVNALPVRLFEQARAKARQFDVAAGEGPGWLAGLPVAIKEFNDVAGVPTTYGSPIYARNIPERSDLTVRNLEAHGAIVLAKSNVPEFAGSNTFNPVYGTTRNPWDLRMTAGGSSGGAAAALAAGEVWLANGSDLGGSLRIPASYCGIAGLRPSVGRVPRGEGLPAFDPLWVEGPMARSVADLALMLDAQVGPEREDPYAQAVPGQSFGADLTTAKPPHRVAFTSDLGLGRQVDSEVVALCRTATARFGSLGAEVYDGGPDLSGSIESYQTLRALMIANVRGGLLPEHRERIAPEIVWNIEKGFNLTAAEILAAEAARHRIFNAMTGFFRGTDILACPTVVLPPFPVEERFPTEVNGEPLETYIDWMFLTFCLSLTGCPCLSVPIGLTKSGLPVGLQLVARPHADADLLAAGHLLEKAIGLPSLPIEPRRGPAVAG